MGFASTALSAGSSILGAVGAINQGSAAASAAGQNARMSEYQAQVARNNKIIAEQNAEHEAQVGMEQAGRKSMEGAATGAKIKVGIASSGIDPNTGSAARVQESQREINKLDTETVLNNSQQKVYGYRAQAANFDAQAGLDTLQENLQWNQVSPDITGGYLKAGATLLSGASSFSGFGGGGTTGNSTFPNSPGGVAAGGSVGIS